MAQVVLTNAAIVINSVDLSNRTNSVTLNYERDQVEVTAFGDAGHQFIGGLQNISIEIECHQDFAAAQTEATIFPLVGTPTTVVIAPASASPSATNPYYTISNTTLTSHTPVAATVGELAVTSLSFAGGSLVKTTSAP